MDCGRISTKKFNFISLNLGKLKNLASQIADPSGFLTRYGRISSLLSTKMEEGLLNTLDQFYDPIYHCFTFPNYQLMPTLEEYSQILSIPIADSVPFSGSEEMPSPGLLAKILQLRESDIKNNLTSKGGLKGFSSKFLLAKATHFLNLGCDIVFESYFALLIYRLLLFPNIEGFIDSIAIRIFLGGNPVLTLLVDTYHSIHYQTMKGGGTITCCIPLLYKWFVSHLPQSSSFWDHSLGLQWSQRLMSLTHSDIAWYNQSLDGVKIIDSCGEFPNAAPQNLSLSLLTIS